jgi:hypothetical protein
MDQVKEYYEKLLNLLDWGRTSSFFGPISFASCIIFGFVSLFYGSTSFTTSLYSLFTGFLIGIWNFLVYIRFVTAKRPVRWAR